MKLLLGKKVLTPKARVAEKLFDKFKGLMFAKEPEFLLFKMREESRVESSLHMLFVFFPLDVAFLNSNKEVVDLAQLKPFEFNYTPARPAKYVLEMPSGTIKGEGIKIGSTIKWS